MAELKTTIEARLRELGWRIPNRGGAESGESPEEGERGRILLAEGARDPARFRLFIHCLDAAEPCLLYCRPVKVIARPEPLAGIIPLDLSSCNLPFRSQVFVRRKEGIPFHYADHCLAAKSGRDLLPLLAQTAARLRRCFLEDYLELLAAEENRQSPLYWLNLLVVGGGLLTLHPEEAATALAEDNPAGMGWEAGCVPLFLPPSHLGETAPPLPDGIGTALAAGPPSFSFRLRYLLAQLPGIYWVVAAQQLEVSLRFILSYAVRWQS
ncbi:MAG: hypothetical protein M0017_05105 [Desulfobacteraceae bacterium]|nr:hypothetical protein [Desulfobacteraceae bacterium]